MMYGYYLTLLNTAVVVQSNQDNTEMNRCDYVPIDLYLLK